MLARDLIVQMQDVLRKEPRILAAYIFGSVAKDVASKESDFDFAVVVEDRRRVNEDRIYDLLRDIRFPKDLDLSVVDKTSSPLFLFQIVSRGKRIYTRDEHNAVLLEAFVLHSYYDTAHIRNIYYQYLKGKFPLQKHGN